MPAVSDRGGNSTLTTFERTQSSSTPITMELPEPVAANLEAEEHSTTTSQPLSKNAQKKAAKAARLLEQKAERRAREKEAKKRKRRERAHAGDVDPRKRRKMAGDNQITFAAQVVIDLGFDDMMTEKVRAQFTSA